MKNSSLHFPFVWKSAQFGYDGTGVKIVKNENDLNTLTDTDCIVEDLIPFKNEFNLMLKNKNADIVKVFTIDGKLILQSKLIANDLTTINTAHLSSGVYFAQIYRKDKSLMITKKIMKK